MDTPVAEQSAAQVPTVIGAPWQGGFYFGRIFVGLQAFALVVAPKADGELVDRQWHDDEDEVEGAKSYFDGLANTEAMVAAGSELANDIRALRIGGHDDWFLPSRQDALVLKGNEEAAGVLFAEGGPQRFERAWYWTSTQHADVPDYAWCQSFDGGGQGYGWKGRTTIRARAVRRVPI
jgi:hypothetical protein